MFYIFSVYDGAKDCYNTIKQLGKRDGSTIDFNKDGQVDVEELEKILGERQARDLMEAVSGSCKTEIYTMNESVCV